MKLLFLVTRLDRPSTRFRVAPLRPWFEARGHTLDVLALPRGVFERVRLYRRLPQYDLIGIQQRLLDPFELRLLRRRCDGLLYDLDDAVMYDERGRRPWRRQRRFRAIARASSLVVCGNRYLAAEATQHSGDVVLIPTAVDTERFHPRERIATNDLVTIGWTGSSSTNRYLNEILPVIAELTGGVRLKVLSSDTRDLDFSRLGRVPYEFVSWSAEREVPETASFDIGLMPLPDNAWTRGKCGCKALQYMALGIAAVCSPVGVNADIIDHGRNGYLAATPQEWSRILNQLVADPQARQTVGEAGRRRVEEAYSLTIQAERLVAAVERVAA